MNQTGIAIPAIEAVQRINEGGWTISGGNRVQNMHFSARPKVTQALLYGETPYIQIQTGIGLFTIPSDDIHLLNDGCTISFRETYTALQERKKAEGGGYKEVQAIRGALVINNQSRLDKLRKEQEDQTRREIEARNSRKAKLRENRRQKVAAMFTNEFVGKKLAKINVGDCGMKLEFEDGTKLDVELDGRLNLLARLTGGDCRYAWINVNGISLDTFSKTR